MSDIETIKRAKQYIDQMANGINPLTGEMVSANDTLNNIQISRCLFFVSSILRDVIDGNGPTKEKARKKKPVFYITDEELSNFNFPYQTTTISSFANAINAHINDEKRGKLKYKDIANWLIEKNYLKEIEMGGSKKKVPSEAGTKIGITTELRNYDNGMEALIVILEKPAQQFILDHIKEITENQAL